MNLHILDLGTGWKLVISFMPRSLYPSGMSPWHPLDRRLSTRTCLDDVERRNILPLIGLEL
jgi:hypothetical protein